MNNSESILNFIDDDEVVQVTRDMVAIPSLTTHEGRGMLEYMERWFDDLNIPYREYPTVDGRANFFADFNVTGNPGRYIFNGHQDTKPVDGMTVDPFGGVIKDGKMYGRGACDMKGGIAAVLCACKALVRAGIKSQKGVTFYSDIEEEFGGPNGMISIIDKGLLNDYDALISCEPTNLEVHIGDKGSITTSFETKGRSAHSGLAHLGINAIQNMALFISEYLELPYLKKENPYFGKSTINFERIQGGLYLSAVPDKCTTCIDSRLIPETPPEEVYKEINGLIERMKREHGIEISEIEQPKSWRPKSGMNKSHYIAPDHDLTRRVADSVKKATGKDAVIGGCPGATIAGQMIKRGIPAIICGPGSIIQAHTEDEWVEIEQLPKAARIYATLMTDM
ncbi:MAG: M20 family metallopeptidase [Candidatus Latescibacteria bacterium]|nr:M20 family metallopeptidase [Candidatus Latescibacterota bacterium]